MEVKQRMTFCYLESKLKRTRLESSKNIFCTATERGNSMKKSSATIALLPKSHHAEIEALATHALKIGSFKGFLRGFVKVSFSKVLTKIFLISNCARSPPAYAP